MENKQNCKNEQIEMGFAEKMKTAEDLYEKGLSCEDQGELEDALLAYQAAEEILSDAGKIEAAENTEEKMERQMILSVIWSGEARILYEGSLASGSEEMLAASEKLFEGAVLIRQEIEQSDPTAYHRFMVVKCLENLANFWRLTKNEGKAFDLYEECLELLDPLYRYEPGNKKIQLTLMNCLNRGLETAEPESDSKKVMDLHCLKLELLEAMKKEAEGEERRQIDSAISKELETLIESGFLNGLPALSQDMAEELVSLTRSCTDESNQYSMFNLAASYLKQGQVLTRCGRLEEAEQALKNAEFWASEAKVPETETRLQTIYYGLAAVAELDEDDRKEQKYLKKSVEAFKNMQDPDEAAAETAADACNELAVLCYRLGDVQEAEENFNENVRIAGLLDSKHPTKKSRERLMEAVYNLEHFYQLKNKA